jgi:hypothetical protein
MRNSSDETGNAGRHMDSGTIGTAGSATAPGASSHSLDRQPKSPKARENCADQAPQAIAAHRAACRTGADRHAEPRFAGRVPHALDDKQFIPKTPVSPPRTLELDGGMEFLAGPKSLMPGRKSLVSGVR